MGLGERFVARLPRYCAVAPKIFYSTNGIGGDAFDSDDVKSEADEFVSDQQSNFEQEASSGQAQSQAAETPNSGNRGNGSSQSYNSSDYESGESVPLEQMLKNFDTELDSEGTHKENPRYQRYIKHYEKNAKEARELSESWTTGVDQVHGERKIKQMRDFHRHKMLIQTGRTRDVFSNNGKPIWTHEPDYEPDYLPRLGDISDASEWVSGGSESGTDYDELMERENPSKYESLKNYRSPYWATRKQLEHQRGENEEEFNTGKWDEQNFTQRMAENAPDEAAGDDNEASGGTSGSDSVAGLESQMSHGTTSGREQKYKSTTEDCPTDTLDELDLTREPLPRLEHETETRSDILHNTLIRVGRHTKVTAGGRFSSSSALVIIGNGDGVGGLGYGKGETISDCLVAALKDAKKKLTVIHRVDNSVSYQSKQKYCRSRVYVWPLAKKMGTRGAYKHQNLMDMFGLTDIRIKTFGRRTDHNIYKALLRCLETSETPEMAARRRGKKVWDINKYWRVNNRNRAY